MFKRSYYVQRAERRSLAGGHQIVRDTSFSSFLCILFIFMIISVFVVIIANWRSLLLVDDEEVENITGSNEHIRKENGDHYENIIISPFDRSTKKYKEEIEDENINVINEKHLTSSSTTDTFDIDGYNPHETNLTEITMEEIPFKVHQNMNEGLFETTSTTTEWSSSTEMDTSTVTTEISTSESTITETITASGTTETTFNDNFTTSFDINVKTTESTLITASDGDTSTLSNIPTIDILTDQSSGTTSSSSTDTGIIAVTTTIEFETTSTNSVDFTITEASEATSDMSERNTLITTTLSNFIDTEDNDTAYKTTPSTPEIRNEFVAINISSTPYASQVVEYNQNVTSTGMELNTSPTVSETSITFTDLNILHDIHNSTIQSQTTTEMPKTERATGLVQNIQPSSSATFDTTTLIAMHQQQPLVQANETDNDTEINKPASLVEYTSDSNNIPEELRVTHAPSKAMSTTIQNNDFSSQMLMEQFSSLDLSEADFDSEPMSNNFIPITASQYIIQTARDTINNKIHTNIDISPIDHTIRAIASAGNEKSKIEQDYPFAFDIN